MTFLKPERQPDFSDRDTVPMDLLAPEPMPRPQVIEWFGEMGRQMYLDAMNKLHGLAA